VLLLTAWRIRRGFFLRIVWPFGVTMRSTTCGSSSWPPFPIAAATIAICSGVTSIRSCPNAIRPASTSESRLG
jgi:hypothetical protein